MCLIAVAWQVHPAYPLVLAANRDEFHARPTAAADWWPDAPGIFGGRDLQAGGTWLGASRHGRFAAITNVREPDSPLGKCSRGALTAAFLQSELSAARFSETVQYEDYAGFNLLLGDGKSLIYCSNREDGARELPPGIYGLSNHRLDTPWPKLLKLRSAMAECLDELPSTAALFRLLSDTTIAPDHELPATGVSLAWERVLSAIFVTTEGYGTRASTVLLQASDGSMQLEEHSFAADGTRSTVLLGG